MFNKQLTGLCGNDARYGNSRIFQGAHPMQLRAQLVVRMIAVPMQSQRPSNSMLFYPENRILPILDQRQLGVTHIPVPEDLPAGRFESFGLAFWIEIEKACHLTHYYSAFSTSSKVDNKRSAFSFEKHNGGRNFNTLSCSPILLIRIP